jgi:hypothetical protein
VIGWELVPHADYQPYMTAFIALDAKGAAYLRILSLRSRIALLCMARFSKSRASARSSKRGVAHRG